MTTGEKSVVSGRHLSLYLMDTSHYKIKEDRRYVTKAAYVVLGITMDGRKTFWVLGSASEGSNF